MLNNSLGVGVVLLVFLESFGYRGELGVFDFVVTVEVFVQVVVANQGVDFHFDFYHVHGVFGFHRNREDWLSIWLDSLLNILFVAFRIHLFEEIFQLFREVFHADNQVFLMSMIR